MARKKRITPTQYRMHLWLDTKERKEVYGIQCKINGKWAHCSEGGKPLFFGTKEAVAAKITELNASKPSGQLVNPKLT